MVSYAVHQLSRVISVTCICRSWFNDISRHPLNKRCFKALILSHGKLGALLKLNAADQPSELDDATLHSVYAQAAAIGH